MELHDWLDGWSVVVSSRQPIQLSIDTRERERRQESVPALYVASPLIGNTMQSRSCNWTDATVRQQWICLFGSASRFWAGNPVRNRAPPPIMSPTTEQTSYGRVIVIILEVPSFLVCVEYHEFLPSHLCSILVLPKILQDGGQIGGICPCDNHSFTQNDPYQKPDPCQHLPA